VFVRTAGSYVVDALGCRATGLMRRYRLLHIESKLSVLLPQSQHLSLRPAPAW